MNYDAMIIGEGPNGLSAAIELTCIGAKTRVIEGADAIGGGKRAHHTYPQSKLFICSDSSPFRGAVHGMCGYYALKVRLNNPSKRNVKP